MILTINTNASKTNNTNDNALEINPKLGLNIGYEEKKEILKSLFKEANKSFKEKKIVRGCSQLYQLKIVGSGFPGYQDGELFTSVKKTVEKYNCNQFNFSTSNQVAENKQEPTRKEIIDNVKNVIHVAFCSDGKTIYPTNKNCSKIWKGVKQDSLTTYEVFLTKVQNPICYVKNGDLVQVKSKCDKSLNHYEVKHDGKNFYWVSEETQIVKKENTKIASEKIKTITTSEKIEKTTNSKVSSSYTNYRELVKKFGPECESSWSNFFTGHKVGTPEFDQCLNEKQDKQNMLAKLEAEKIKTEKEIFMSLTIEEKRAFTCTRTFGFKKGSDKFKDCVFKIYAAELELEKLEVEKQLAEAQLETAKAHREAAEAKVLAAKAQGELQKAQIQATEAQAAASQQQAAASKAQAAATKQQSSMSLLMQGLQMLQPPTQPQSFKTTCRWSGGFFNCW